MSKKDYIAIADALRPMYATAKAEQARPHPILGMVSQDTADAIFNTLEDCAEALANVFAADNPAFNRSRWFAYLRGECGPNGGPVKSPKS